MYPNRYRAGDPEYGPSKPVKRGGLLPTFKNWPLLLRLPARFIVFVLAIPIGLGGTILFGVGISLFFLLNDICALFAGIYYVIAAIIRKIVELGKREEEAT